MTYTTCCHGTSYVCPICTKISQRSGWNAAKDVYKENDFEEINLRRVEEIMMIKLIPITKSKTRVTW